MHILSTYSASIHLPQSFIINLLSLYEYVFTSFSFANFIITTIYIKNKGLYPIDLGTICRC